MDAFRLETPGRVFEGVPGVEFVVGHRVRTLTALDLQAGREVEAPVEDSHGAAQELQMQFQEAHGLALTFRIRLYPGRPFVLMRISVTNVGPDRAALRRFFVRTEPDGLTTVERPTGFFASGWQSRSRAGLQVLDGRDGRGSGEAAAIRRCAAWNPATPQAPKVGRFWSETVGAIVTPREALIGGIVSTGDQFGQLYADLRPAHLQVVLQTQLDDVPLAVGEARQSEWFYLEWVPLPNADPFSQYAVAVARAMAVPAIRPAPAGWCSWQVAGSAVGEGDVMTNLASAALLADELPLSFLRLDDGYQATWGDWSTRSSSFPHALQWLADRITGADFTPGLWLAPLIADRRSRLARDHPSWLLRGPHGGAVRVQLASGIVGRALDATHPEVIDHLSQLVRMAVSTWGYNYLSIDGLVAAALRGRRHNPQLTRAQVVRQALQVIREAAGPDTYLATSGTPLGPAVGLVDAMRIGADSAPWWAPKARSLSRVGTRRSAQPSLKNALRNIATRSWMHGRWWANDADALTVGDAKTELTMDEVVSHATLVGLSGSAPILSDDLDHIPTARRAMVACLFPQLLEGTDVLDLLENPMPEVAVVPVARPWGRWRLVAVFNWADTPVERDLPDGLALSDRVAYHIVDFWEQRYLSMGLGAPRPVLHIPTHGVVLLSVRPQLPDPHLVATTFHISQGGEVTHWSADDGLINVGIELGRAARGAVWLSLPARPDSVWLDGGLLPAKAVRAVAPGVWSIACQVNRVATLRIAWGARVRALAS
jgi:alpha-galactosidase